MLLGRKKWTDDCKDNNRSSRYCRNVARTVTKLAAVERT